MKNHYNKPEWRAFRAEIIRLYDGICNRCSRGQTDGVVLQVHHKIYIPGRFPWQYRHDECEALCQGCHAEEHGKIIPKSGWEHFGFIDDLGGLDGECELCGTAIRYVFPVYHVKWGTMEVGEICCDHLTETTFATDLMKHVERRVRFVSSSRWRTSKSGDPCITQKHVMLGILQDGAKYRLQMNGIIGKLEFDSVLVAKINAFDLLESGAADAFLQKMRRRAMDRYRNAVLPSTTASR